MTTQPTVQDHFELAIQGEAHLHQLYMGLAEKFATTPDARAFWQQMAADETEHATRLIDIRDALSPEQLAELTDMPSYRGLERAMTPFLSETLAHVQNLQDAYELATELETGEFNAAFKLLVENFLWEEEASLSLILSKLELHIGKLTSFINIFGTLDQRLDVKAVDT
jgi:rubrerythrin